MSNPIPSSLALISIAAGSDILSSDHRTNYSDVQTRVNALITALSGGVAGQALLAAGAASVQWGSAPGAELAYAQKTTDTSITATTAAAANVVATTAAVTFDGATAAMIEVFTAAAFRGTTWIKGVVFMDGALLQDGAWYNTVGTVGQAGRYRYTPAAGSHTFGFAAYVDAGSGTIGATGFAPAHVRVTKAAA